MVDMVFFSSPEPSVGKVAEEIKSKLLSFIWVPWEEVEEYLKKSDAILIGPGFMRFRSEGTLEEEKLSCDEACRETKKVTEELLQKFPDKKWVIDAGSLQVMDPTLIPEGAILTPNKKEYEIPFGNLSLKEAAKKFKCIIVLKGPTTQVVSAEKTVDVTNGNAGLTKGGTGDVQAGLTVALLSKNEAFLSASCASYLVKKAADELFQKVGAGYSADDLADFIPATFHNLRK